MIEQKIRINPTTHLCELCDYTTIDKKDFKKHLQTKKHLERTIKNKNDTQKLNIKTTTKIYYCNCSKQYKSRSGLWNHLRSCENTKNPEKSGDDINDKINDTKLLEVFASLMKQNQEFKELMLEENKELLKTIQDLIPKIGNNNTTNNSFNLNVFLNETCKDALNMVDFVKSMNLQLVDLEETGKLGYSGGLSRIFINGLKELDINKRPIHCSDLKREVLYIKEDNVWEKDNEQRTKIKKAIREIEHKNIKQIPLFIKEHPNCIIGSNRENISYLKMVMQSTGGNQSEEENNINKIITNIAKEVIINK
jgi:hypothetical protein